MWAAGCIYFELLTSKPLLPIDNGEVGVWKGMIQLFGVPNEVTWPGISNLNMYPQYRQVKELRIQPKGLKALFA